MSSTSLVYMTVEWESGGLRQEMSGYVEMDVEHLSVILRQMSANGSYSISTESAVDR